MDDSFDPHTEFEELEVDEEVGFDEEELEDVIDTVRGDTFEYAGKVCRVRRTETNVTGSSARDWIVGVYLDWPPEYRTRAKTAFERALWDISIENGQLFLEVRVGHERQHTREDAEREAEWMAEQAVMLENDPNAPN